MRQRPVSIPRPLVRTNQWTIFLSVVITWITGQYWILLIPFIANLLGFMIGFNPVIRIAKLFLKKDVKDYIPEDAVQQRFNSSIATCCLGGGLVGFAAGFPVVGYIFTVMVAIASFIAILGFCVGCFIHFQWNQYVYRKKQRSTLKEN
ncbi:DUF4395 domain-containing protein [Lysinibacillus odysseyi]|uniref:DUF4395 domain-containing protein n=1 Tax=Lysinibacillus odysseyi 34hs-1 = NBRC 100172 TaxID=1220589 RepID=A0A0A3ISN3_9BACI|nr:DUF4395 domain-containing protein [Lysinibacillus odysseyi]KGR85878.1 hypothetical protein CD32_08535 [Lysinibacillus odysseyi 34hs-1 = NBRC 100172]